MELKEKLERHKFQQPVGESVNVLIREPLFPETQQESGNECSLNRIPQYLSHCALFGVAFKINRYESGECSKYSACSSLPIYLGTFVAALFSVHAEVALYNVNVRMNNYSRVFPEK